MNYAPSLLYVVLLLLVYLSDRWWSLPTVTLETLYLINNLNGISPLETRWWLFVLLSTLIMNRSYYRISKKSHIQQSSIKIIRYCLCPGNKKVCNDNIYIWWWSLLLSNIYYYSSIIYIVLILVYSRLGHAAQLVEHVTFAKSSGVRDRLQ